MNEYNLKVDWEQMTSLMLLVLKEDLDNLRRDWNRVYSEGRGHVFSNDTREDLEQISEHIIAYKKVLRYYGEQI